MSLLHDELNFIKPGETWAIVGESGSGHSTLLSKIRGNHVEQVAFRHHFRNLSNTADFYYQQRFNSSDSEDALTVGQHLSSLTNGRPGYWTVEKTIERLNLQPLMEEQVIKLSNGETKRLLIASALVSNPQILVLDHPLTGLDVDTRASFGLLLKEVSGSGVQVVMATNPWEIPDAVTHVAVMADGKIIHEGKRESFSPAKFNFIHEIHIDTGLLQHLLAFDSKESFDVVVGMKDVTIKYDDRIILDRINWTVQQAERWALSGPNGAGKSTLLSLINGDNPQAYANDIVLFDRKRGSGESIWDIKKRIGFISPELFQYFPLDSSGLQVIESGFYDTIGLFRPTDPEKETIARQWMQLLKIDRYADKLFSMVPPDVQRLCLLARALVKNPTLLILDEPTQGLDSYQQQFFTQLIDAICAASNVTLIYVSHYQHHIPQSVDKRIRIEQGRIH